MANRVIHIGQTLDIPVTVLDQRTNPIATFDFTANPPTVTSDQPSAVAASFVAPNIVRVHGIATTSADAQVTISDPAVANIGIAFIGVDTVFVPIPTDFRFDFSGTPTP